MQLGDTYYGEMRDKLSLKTTDAQDRACCFLEGRGQRFLVDFGYENAIEKMKEIKARAPMNRQWFCVDCNSATILNRFGLCDTCLGNSVDRL